MVQSPSLSWELTTAPSSKRCFPAAQSMHSACNEASDSSLSLYLPASQIVQAVTAALLNLPIAHVWHVEDKSGSCQAAGVSFPRGQTEQDPLVKELREPSTRAPVVLRKGPFVRGLLYFFKGEGDMLLSYLFGGSQSSFRDRNQR